MLNEKISSKKKSVRGRVLALGALIGICILVIGLIYGTIGIPTAISTVTRHYPGCSAFAAFQGCYNRYFLKTFLVKKYQSKCRMINEDKDDFQLWDTPTGQYWMPPGEETHSVPFLLAEMDLEIYTKGNQRIFPGDIVIDCGAHVGFFTRAALTAGAKLVVAIEIAPANLVCLKRNLSTEIAAGRVIICEKGVWDKDDYMDLYIYDTSGGDSLILHDSEQDAVKVKVPLTILDKIVIESGLQRVDFVKMDIEGAERNALKGAVKTLQQFKPKVSVCVYHLEDDLDVISALVRQIRPDYLIDYGPIFADQWGLIFPKVMYFR